MPPALLEQVKPLVIKLLTDWNSMKTTGPIIYPQLLDEFQAIVAKVAPFIPKASAEVQAACKELQAKVKEMKPPGTPDKDKVNSAVQTLEKIGSLVMPKSA